MKAAGGVFPPFPGAGDQTQGLKHTKKVLYPQLHTYPSAVLGTVPLPACPQ